MLVAEHQEAGRGRLDRVWTSPPRAGLTVSLLLRPDVPGRAPGLAAAAHRGRAGRGGRRGRRACAPSLKWPNDLLAARRPQAGRHPRRELRRGRSSSASGSTCRRRPTSCPTPGRRWRWSPAATVDRGAGAAGLPARVRAALPAVGRGARRPGLLRPGRATTSRWSLHGRDDGRGHPARRVDPRGRRRGGRLGRPAGGRAPPAGTVELASGDVRHVRRDADRWTAGAVDAARARCAAGRPSNAARAARHP